MEGLTRFSYQLMAKRVTITQIHRVTHIPVPTLSMYANGHRNISASHRSILSAILDLPTDAIVGYCTTEVLAMATPVEPAPEPDEEPSHPPTTPDE